MTEKMENLLKKIEKANTFYKSISYDLEEKKISKTHM